MDTEAPISPSSTKTILVDDDNPSTRLICVKKLRAEGLTVSQAEGSTEALKILDTRQEPIDLLLTDLMLPPSGPSIYLHPKSVSAGFLWSRRHPTCFGHEEDIPRDPHVESVVSCTQGVSNGHRLRAALSSEALLR